MQTKNVVPYLLQGAILTLSVLGGLYLGQKYIFAEPQQIYTESADQRLPYPDNIKLTFKTGEALPLLTFTDSAGVQYSSADLIGEKGSIFIFGSMSCTECPLLLREWNDLVAPKIISDVNVYALLPEGETFFTDWELELFKGKMLLFYNQNAFERDYNLVALPSILCVTSTGEVFDIQYGHGVYYHREIIEQYTTWDVTDK